MILLFHRKKLGSNVPYVGSADFNTLVQSHNGPFAYVTKKSLVTLLKIVLKDLRDIDVIKETLGKIRTNFNMHIESIFFHLFYFFEFDIALLALVSEMNAMTIVHFLLGSISTRYSLTSDGYISNRMIQKIDGKTSSIMENGLYQFYQSFSTYLLELKGSKFVKRDEEDDESALNMQQLIKPLIHHFGLLAICLGFLLIEVIIYRRHQLLNRLLCFRFLLNSSRVDVLGN